MTWLGYLVCQRVGCYDHWGCPFHVRLFIIYYKVSLELSKYDGSCVVYQEVWAQLFLDLWLPALFPLLWRWVVLLDFCKVGKDTFHK